MNEALLLKWWWRFGTEKEALWRRLIGSQYHMDSNTWQNSKTISVSRLEMALRHCSGWMLGLRDRPPICSTFPRIFSIISTKHESVLAAVFQRKMELDSWDIQFRGILYSWEVEEMNSIYEMLDMITLVLGNNRDRLAWKDCKSNKFTVSSMYKLATNLNQTNPNFMA